AAAPYAAEKAPAAAAPAPPAPAPAAAEPSPLAAEPAASAPSGPEPEAKVEAEAVAAAAGPSTSAAPAEAESPAAEAGSSSGGAAEAAIAAEGGPEAEAVTVPDEEAEEEKKDKGLKPNAARGADLERYSWGQTLSEVTVTAAVPKGTKGKMMEVLITKTHFKLGLKGQAPIIEPVHGPHPAERRADGRQDQPQEMLQRYTSMLASTRAELSGEPPVK
ncbi:Nuclear migration protein nudC, partial [Tetrabaena socialis]